MNTRIPLIVLTVIALAIAGWSMTRDQYTFASGSRIWVEGTSTVHDWSCEAGRVTGTVAAEPGTGGLASISSVTVNIPVTGLDCSNGTMNGKLRDALNASANPNISFSLSSAQVGSVNNGRFAIEASGRLSIAGTTRTMNISAVGQPLSNGRFRITGSVPFAMSSFGVDPPTALLGTLRTRDNVTVRFDVTLQS
ncbi:MAG: YceI family protein [Rubricoccaceae bacterium]|nr:YceI family protein [Rubricoccaceae bacterium]